MLCSALLRGRVRAISKREFTLRTGGRADLWIYAQVRRDLPDRVRRLRRLDKLGEVRHQPIRQRKAGRGTAKPSVANSPA
jgi:hypothetical protein